MTAIAGDEFWKSLPKFTDEEVELAAEFDEALLRGERPDMEAFLARLPLYEERLRPVLEMSCWLRDEFARIRRQYPGFRAWHLIGLPARCRP